MTNNSKQSDVTVIDHTDVGFVPNRFFPQIGNELMVATASNLIREFGECPECEGDIDPDVSGGVQSDRDVIWTEQTSDQPGRYPCDRSDSHTCEHCGTELRLFVEEKARPAHWSEIPNEHWAKSHLWIEMEDGSYFVTNPSHISVTSVQG